MPIEDFIPSYPQTNKDFTFEFSRLKEINELTLNAGYTKGVEEGLFPNQTLIKRFFSGATDYPSAIIANEVGTGKSRAAAAVAEYWKSQMNGIVPRSKALVLVKNDVLARNFINEVLEYTKGAGEYISRKDEDEKDVTEETVRSRLTKEVKKVYEIETFGTFLVPRGENAVSMTSKRAREEYSDRVIIIDEIHNIRPQSEAGRSFKDGDEPAEAKEDEEEVYKKLHEFLHAVERCRILLMTGTPAVDQASEIADLMNLILPLNSQLQTGSSFFKHYFEEDRLSERGQRELSEAFRGRVFYLRAVNSGVKRTTIGVTSPYTLHIKVYPSRMSELQTSVVRASKKRVSGKGEKAQGGGGVAKVMPLSASLCVIPKKKDKGYSYEYGNEGCLDVCGKNVKDPNKTTYSLPSYVVDLYKNDLSQYSAKYASFIRLVEEHPDEVTFAFSKFSKGSGAVLLGMILEQVCGWQRIRTSKEIMYPDERRKRFAIISGEKYSTHSDSEIQALLTSHNRPENWDGKYLRLIIGTTKISEGVTIKHVRQFHNLVPLWNFPTLIQATARAIRFGSHEHIPEDQRRITLYNHIAIYDDTPSSETSLEGNDIPTDVEVYRIAEEKSFKIALVYRALKENSVDCVTNYKRNVLELDEEGSRDTDYQQRNYVCAGFPDQYIDRNTIVWNYNIPADEIDSRNYNYLYSNQEQERFENEIRGLFHKSYELSLWDIIAKLKVKKEDVPALVKALAKLVEYRYILRDRLGFMNYLYEHDNVYKLSSVVESGNIFEERQSLEDIVEASEMSKDFGRIQKFCFDSYDSYSYNTRVIVIETLFVYELHGRKLSPKLKELLESHRSKFYKVKGGWVYNFKSEMPVSTGYAAGIDKVTESSVHFLADGTQTWINVDDPEIISEADMRRRDEMDLGEVGGYVEGGRFKLKSKSKGGKTCTSFDKSYLFRLLEKLNYIPDPDSFKNSYKNSTRDELIQIYNGIQKDKEEKFMYREDLRTIDIKKLRGIIATMDASKPQLCDILQAEYERRGLLVKK